MRLLFTESEPGDAGLLGALLATDGHQVAFCAQVCPGRCPLRESDAVVAVRLAGGPLTERERGVRCALGEGTRLIVAGDGPQDGTLAGSPVMPADEVLAACAAR